MPGENFIQIEISFVFEARSPLIFHDKVCSMKKNHENIKFPIPLVAGDHYSGLVDYLENYLR